MDRDNINITVENHSGGAESHGWQVLGTLLACGALGMGAWALSAAGMLELAATATTMFGFQLTRMMISAGIIALPQSSGEAAFRETSGMLRTASKEFTQWQARSPIWRLAALALAYTLGFLAARWAISVALGIFGNPWIAGAASMAAAAVIVSPRLFGGIARRMSRTALSGTQTQADQEKEETA